MFYKITRRINVEIFDGYLKDGSKSGMSFVRGQIPPKGVYQLICDVLVRHKDGDYLLMQRDYNKPTHAGEFEATAGGSALKGETALECIKRELREETGLKCQSFEKINDIFYDDRRCWFQCFFCETDCDKDSITLQVGETIDYKWIKEDEFKKFLNSACFNQNRKKRFLPYFKKLGYID